ncbi:sulfite exporter TauE/SafE family protein [Roseovarius aestuariivivens]|uniref:sulfite exporter TauE/SafE family protein n=1 Tax=Roseovarius aestuariivivens TaxID=1888910 RepID=UPI0010812B29|nr:sulfite exporter TauE/SafE family protein [Roseovarius aestuariivivens]
MAGFGWDVFAVGVFAAMFSGISKGGFGSGAAFAGSSILALFVDPGTALGIMLPLLMLIDATSVRAYWRKWSWPDARLMLLGALPGVLFGAALYSVVDDDVIRLLIGTICLVFVAWQVMTRSGAIAKSRTNLPRAAGVVAGIITGFTSFVSHAGGPPAAVYLLSRGLEKTTYQSTTVLVFWIMNIVKFVPYAFLGMFTLRTLTVDLFLAPFAVLGAWLGVKAHRLVSENLFFGLTYLLLVVTGIKLIWDALG